ncbi:hypothetical protein FM107_11490 [Sphingobacterium sp. JB170]|nr:hypothetical protein FM107_11490 [Sphingobacterium sp. JB170]
MQQKYPGIMPSAGHFLSANKEKYGLIIIGLYFANLYFYEKYCRFLRF